MGPKMLFLSVSTVSVRRVGSAFLLGPSFQHPSEHASTCALFTAEAYEKLGIKVVTFGGNPGEVMDFNGVAGNQVFGWADLDPEIKTTGLKNGPLAPPDLLVSANYRINSRYA
ncbi:hypothetical protein FS749_003077 [Ceratobasidium sp. UAMH 11750]|nr:hypothetical protein FS749_003077 [Ceratobasidium sp. UAMH 11750]